MQTPPRTRNAQYVIYDLDSVLARIDSQFAGFMVAAFGDGVQIRNQNATLLETAVFAARSAMISCGTLVSEAVYTKGYGASGAADDLTLGTVFTAASVAAQGTTFTRGANFVPNGAALMGGAVGDFAFGAVIDFTVSQNAAIGTGTLGLFGQTLNGPITIATSVYSTWSVATSATIDIPSGSGKFRCWLFANAPQPAGASRTATFNPILLRQSQITAGSYTAGVALHAVVGFAGSILSGNNVVVPTDVTLLTRGTPEIGSLSTAAVKKIRERRKAVKSLAGGPG